MRELVLKGDQLVMRRFVFACVVIGLMTRFSGVLWAADGEGHCFGEWPAINAMIHDEKQHNLNPQGLDFLIEVWFKPLPKVKAKGMAVNTLVAKRLSGRLAGYDLGYMPNGDVYFAICDAGRELENDLSVGASCGLVDNQWYYVAAGRSGDTLRLYKDGVLAKDIPGSKIGSISNQDAFNVSLGSGGTQAHCQIKEVRFWRVKQGARVNFDAVVAQHGREPGKLAQDLVSKSDFSRWSFGPEGETVKDLGNNGNTLMYVPLGYHPQDVIAIKPFPEKPLGKTYYVDISKAVAADTNPGSQERPFQSIGRGLKELRPGDVLHICKGRYFLKETLLLPRGENGNPVTIEGEEGTVLYGSEPLTGWTKADNGVWTIKDWKGGYQPPSDVREWDARSHPGNILFAGDDLVDYVTTKTDLAPGCWNVEPVEGRGPKTLYFCPMPGMDPNTAKTEITVCPGIFQPSEFNHIRNLHFTRAAGAMGIGGRGHVIENNRIDWMGGGAFGVYGQDIVIRNNRIEWTGGIGGSCARVLFEKNILRFNAWRILDAGWAGGAVKFIPCCKDHVLRGNEFAYNRTATIWYDAGNEGIVIEDNLIHDNQAGGIFDEFGFGNTMRGNIIYNNAGGICLGNSCSDRVERNIFFNNNGSAIFLRGASFDRHKQTDAAKRKQDADESMSKLDVRRYQGMLTWESEKPYRDMLLKYWSEYSDAEICRHNTFVENVLFDNGEGGWEDTVRGRPPYGLPGAVVDPDAENTYRNNYYGASPAVSARAKAAQKGAADLAAWQKASGQDAGSVWTNPWDKAKMPEWYQQKMAAFSEGQFRPYQQIVDLTGGDVRKYNPSRLLLRGRLAESKYLKVVEFKDSAVRGAYFDAEEKRCLALWSRGGTGIADWMLPAGQTKVVVENKWLNRTTVSAQDGRISLYITEDPTVLIDVAGEIQEDRSIVIRIPDYNEPGKPVTGMIQLENQGQTEQLYDLSLRCGDGFDGNVDRIAENVAPGASVQKALSLTPKAGTGKGAYQVNLEGAVGGRKVKKTKGFILGSRNIAPQAHISIDGDLSDWERAKVPTEVANGREQIALGKEAWRGGADCSAKMRLAWEDDYQLFIGIEVTDDKLVTNHRKDKPTESDSVQIFLDVRTPWKLYINDYGVGAFQLLIVPSSADNPEPTVEYIGAVIAHQKLAVTKKTDKGYNVEVRLRFRNMDEPGWVAGREFRVGALVNDSDDPVAGRKSVLGLWRTALDADKSCVSLTRFTLQE